MAAVDTLRDARTRELVAEDGEPVRLHFDPPLSDDEVARFERTLPCPLPDDVRELLRFCRGFEGGAADFVDFTGARCNFSQEDVFPYGLPFAADGFGNFWVVDLVPDSKIWGPIYFACHDAPVILYQSPHLDHFLIELLKLSVPPHKGLVQDVHDDRLFQVWRKNPGIKTHPQCLESGDAILEAFARELDASYQIVDMRSADIGFGFSWGRYGPDTTIRRCGMLPIFAYRRP